MGKPLSRPDCLRQNPPCVGKGEEEEDLNIEDCYVPQRSIYDTVRLNEQIDSGSKGSLSSRHFTDRTLPYSHRTLDVGSLCSNGAPTSSSAFELRGREANKLDEKMIFDALKLNSDIIRTTAVSKAKSHTEKKENRRSWRMFVPPNFTDFANKSENSFVDSADLSGISKASKCRWGTSSLTSEEDDSGLCSPPGEREEKQDVLMGTQTRIRSLSSAEEIHVAEQQRPFISVHSTSEQKIPLLSSNSEHIDKKHRLILHAAPQLETTELCELQKYERDQREIQVEYCHIQNGLKESIMRQDTLLLPRNKENNHVSDNREGEKTCEVCESEGPQIRKYDRELVGEVSQVLDTHYTDVVRNNVDYSSITLLENVILYGLEKSDITPLEEFEVQLSHLDMESEYIKSSPESTPIRNKAASWKISTPTETLQSICNGFPSVEVIN
uniref:Uncharacterized protein n=1 Tax=Monodelphis domestica TaxID=13616 RepID=A0A5F8HLV8_MONDO